MSDTDYQNFMKWVDANDECDCELDNEAFSKCCGPKYGIPNLETAMNAMLSHVIKMSEKNSAPRFAELSPEKQKEILDRINANQ